MKRLAAALALPVLLASAGGASAHRDAAPCQAGQLRARLVLQGATGSLVGGVYVRNVGQRTCALVGQPQPRLVGGGARSTRWEAHSVRPLGREGIGHRPTSTLRGFRPGARALLRIQWSNWCRPGSYPDGKPGRPPRSLVIRLPSGVVLSWRLGGSTPRCDAPERPSYLAISRFVPV